MNSMTYNKEANALYIYMKDTPACKHSHTETVVDDEVMINVDYDDNNEVIGIEVLA